MTGKKRTERVNRRSSPKKETQQRPVEPPPTQPQASGNTIMYSDDNASIVDTIAPNIKKEQPLPPQAFKKIIKTEYDEARTLKVVFKSNPDSQMKEFIKKAAKPTAAISSKQTVKTPADNHPPAVVQELLETDDDVADNLGKLFKTSKSLKNNQ